MYLSERKALSIKVGWSRGKRFFLENAGIPYELRVGVGVSARNSGKGRTT